MSSIDKLTSLATGAIDTGSTAAHRLFEYNQTTTTSHYDDITSLRLKIEIINTILVQIRDSLNENDPVRSLGEPLLRDFEDVYKGFTHAFDDVVAACDAESKTTGEHQILQSQSKYSLHSQSGLKCLRSQISQCSTELNLIRSLLLQDDEVQRQQEVTNYIKHDLGYLKSSNVAGIAHCFTTVLKQRESQQVQSPETMTREADPNGGIEDDTRSEKTVVQPSGADTKPCLGTGKGGDRPLPEEAKTAPVIEDDSSANEPLITRSEAPKTSSAQNKPHEGPVSYHAFHTPFSRQKWTFERSARHEMPDRWYVHIADAMYEMVDLDRPANAALRKFLDENDLELLRLEIWRRSQWSPRAWVTRQLVKRMVVLAESKTVAEKRREQKDEPVGLALEASPPDSEAPDKVASEGKVTRSENPGNGDGKVADVVAPPKPHPSGLAGLERRIIRNTVAKELIAALKEYWGEQTQESDTLTLIDAA